MCRRSSCRKSTGLIQQRSHVAICDWNVIAGTGFSATTDQNCKVGELQQYHLSLLHFDRLCVGCHNLGPWYQRSWFVRKTPKNRYVNVSDQSSIFINKTKILISYVGNVWLNTKPPRRIIQKSKLKISRKSEKPVEICYPACMGLQWKIQHWIFAPKIFPVFLTCRVSPKNCGWNAQCKIFHGGTVPGGYF